MKTEINIFEQGLEEYPKASIILGNLIMVLWIALGTVACWFLYPMIAWVYLALAIAMVGVILRKLVCTKCYYYDRWCSMGWGKLSALLFRQGDIEILFLLLNPTETLPTSNHYPLAVTQKILYNHLCSI